MDDIPKLGIRKGLPEDLLFLTRKHPRETWPNQPALAGTGEIWLANHDYFRAITARIGAQLLQLRETGETSYDSGPALRRHIGSLLGNLDGHHRIEGPCCKNQGVSTLPLSPDTLILRAQ